jgi:hypothetical protein
MTERGNGDKGPRLRSCVMVPVTDNFTLKVVG